jgi:hypothetical protein
LSRTTSVLAATGALATLAALLLPASGARASGGSCTAWGTLPARVVLGPSGATVRTSLHGTAGCRPGSFDNGGTAVLRGPGRNDDVPMRWDRFGATDEAVYYPSLNEPGTYRLVDGETQIYDRDERHIPSTWHATSTVVKYKGRFVRVSTGGGVTATLQSYGYTGWAGHRRVVVHLQKRTASGTWRTVASARSGAGGRVHLAARASTSGNYRLVSATTASVWGAVRVLHPAAGV